MNNASSSFKNAGVTCLKLYYCRIQLITDTFMRRETMIVKVRFKNKIAEPLMNATDFCVKTKEKKGKTYHCLEFKVDYSMGIKKTYSFDSHDEKLINDLYDRISNKGEFLFDTLCTACEETISCTELDYDKYVEMSKCGELSGELKFGGEDYVVTV